MRDHLFVAAPPLALAPPRAAARVGRARGVAHVVVAPRRVRVAQRVAPRCDASETPPTRALDREIIALALPALGALALDPLLSLIDTAFVGRLGVSAIAGVGLATIVLNVSFSVFNFLSISITPLVAASVHESRAATSRVTSTGLLLALFLGTCSMAVMTVLARPICLALGAAPAALPNATTYLRIRALAAPFALASYVANGALRGHKDLRTPFQVALLANLTNILLDLVLIFPLRLGVAGAALATSLSQVLAVCLMTASLLRRDRLRLPDLARLPPLRELRPLLGAGAMLSIRTLSLLATVAYATSTAAARGVIELAAYELCRQLWVFKSTILDSFAAAAQALVASCMATRALRRARAVADRTLQLSAGLGLVLGVVAVGAGAGLPALFTGSAAVARRAADCIRMAAVCAPLNGAVFALDGILAACEDYRYMAGAIALASFVACVALTGVRVWGGSVVAVWGGLNLLMVARGVVLFWRYWGRKSPMRRGEGKEA